MFDIEIEKVNSVFIRIRAERNIILDLAEDFMFAVEGAIWSPKHKNNGGLWDGNIRLLNSMTGQIYAGLEKKVIAAAQDRGYTVKSYIETNDIPDDLGYDLVDRYCVGDKYKKRSYQNDAVVTCLREKRAFMISPTSSGKSLTMYLIARYIMEEMKETVLIIVPSTGLVKQFLKDIQEYSGDTMDIQIIYAGQDKNIESPLVITTWQSAYKLGNDWLNQFGCVFGDEAHEYTAKSVKSMLEKMTNVEYRFGFTGTLDEDETPIDPLVLEGLFGPIKQVVTTRELIEDGTLADFKVKFLILKHTGDNAKAIHTFSKKKANKKKAYQNEIKFLDSHEARTDFICNLAKSQVGKNGLIFVNKVEDHGHKIYEKLRGINSHTTHYIHGKIKVDERERIRAEFEEHTDNIAIATYGTTSRGVNIVNLDYIIFAHSSKSKYRNLQSIGRVLRRGEGDSKAVLYDLTDDLTFMNNSNYSIEHFKKRVELYSKEGFEYSIHKFNLRE